MNTHSNLRLILAGLGLSLTQFLHAQSTAFHYQGRLTDGTSLAAGSYDLRFGLRDAAVEGNQIGASLVFAPVAINDGLLDLTLDFGTSTFNGSRRWLEIAVRTNGSLAPYVILSPRPEILPSPYAIHATDATTLSGKPESAFAPATGSSRYVSKDGDTMIGPLRLPSNGLAVGSDQFLVSAGSVGIGVSSPGSKLHVVDANPFVLIEGTSGIAGIRLKNSLGSGAIGTIYAGDDGIGGANNVVIADNNNTPRMVVNTASGNLGIGTLNPVVKLHMVGDQAYIQGTANLAALDVNQGGTGAAALFRGGDVGIGLVNPVTKLHISGAGIGLPATAGVNQSPGHIVRFAPGDNAILDIGGNSSGGIWFQSTDQTSLAVNYPILMNPNGGNVGIGTSSPSENLTVSGSPTPSIGIRRSDNLRTFKTTILNTQGGVTFDVPLSDQETGDVAFNFSRNGRQSDLVTILGNGAVGIGTNNPQAKLHINGTVRVTGSLNLSNGELATPVLLITGGADVAEPFQMPGEIPKGSVVVIDDENPGRLKLSTCAYDKRVAGIISGANGIKPGMILSQEGVIEGGQNVALSGRVFVRADTSSGPIKPGDLLTTSAQAGHAMKVTDHSHAQGAILGKAMSTLNEGEGMVLALVTLQ